MLLWFQWEQWCKWWCRMNHFGWIHNSFPNIRNLSHRRARPFFSFKHINTTSRLLPLLSSPAASYTCVSKLWWGGSRLSGFEFCTRLQNMFYGSRGNKKKSTIHVVKAHSIYTVQTHAYMVIQMHMGNCNLQLKKFRSHLKELVRGEYFYGQMCPGEGRIWS